MGELLFPPAIIPRESVITPAANVGRFPSPLTQATRTVDRSGHLWRMTVEPPVLTGSNARAIQAFLAAVFGGADRIFAPDHSYVRAGAFPAVELLTNPSFEQGTAGWSSDYTLSASDRVLRSTVDSADGVSTARFLEQQVTGLTANVPYVWRLMSLAGKGASFNHRLYAGPTTFTSDYGVSASTTTPTLHTLAIVPPATSAFFGWQQQALTGVIAGDFLITPFTSVSRCLLVDAGPNALLQSDAFDNAAWIKTLCAFNVNVTVDPFGTSTADGLGDGLSAGDHYASQSATVSSAAADYCGYAFFKASVRGFGFMSLSHAAGEAKVFINLTTGATGNTAIGTDWANGRAFSRDYGNGWWLLSWVARKTGSQTSITLNAGSASAMGTSSYTGTDSTAIYLFRGGMAQSSVPVRPVQTTTAATSGASPTGGVIHVKGGRGPAEGALAGALLVGDLIEVQTSRGPQLMKLTASLDLDAAGLGTIIARPPLRGSVLDNAAVILHNPIGKWLPVNPQSAWRNKLGRFTEAEPLELIEDIVPL